MERKQYIYIFMTAALLLMIWMIYSVIQPPKWEGTSQSSLWSGDYNREAGAPKGDWIGYLYWHGEKNIVFTGAKLTRNGEEIHQLEYRNDKLAEKYNKINYFHSWDSMFQNKEDELQLQVYWEDSNGKYEDLINLSPRKRLFVVPSWLY
ncbi:hypothetical protein [Bacillus mesophilum]|uniref:DUF4944 domain-containing protein n=1 Tax=Bacillus mesophilum TaxID=1071718 RepID=A0A7V7UWJ1_9BACI|nr:hypothetical protein [Bacillus mesophilum]KAB2333969.1 hypothetical protein F7732_07755 [Bacillus mesophilum]